jgi:hypothetical protein
VGSGLLPHLGFPGTVLRAWESFLSSPSGRDVRTR